MIKLREALLENLKYIESPSFQESNISGLATGFDSIDRHLHGLRPGKLILIGGHYEIERSALALQWSLEAAKQTSKAIAFFSYDLLSSQISMRLISIESEVDLIDLKHRHFDGDHLRSILDAIQTLSNLSLFIEDDETLCVASIRKKCLRLKEELGVSLIVIDYIQLIPFYKSNQEQIIKELKNLTMELDVPVVVVTELSRMKEKYENYRLSTELLKMGPLYNYADIICIIHRDYFFNADDYRKDIAKIIIAKDREGGPGTYEVKWIVNQLRYEKT